MCSAIGIEAIAQVAVHPFTRVEINGDALSALLGEK
jgi:hypothetical protein